MIDIRLLGGLAIVLVIFVAGNGIYNGASNFLQEQFYGQEYCFTNIDKSSITLVSQGVEVRYTKTEGDELCFRTKDFSMVEKINKQIQDRKYQENLAKIQSQDQFRNETIPFIVLVIAATFIIIAIISYLSTGKNYQGF